MDTARELILFLSPARKDRVIDCVTCKIVFIAQ